MAIDTTSSVDLAAASPSIVITSNVPSGYAIKTYIRKSNIKTVTGIKSANLDNEGNVISYKWVAVLNLVDGTKEEIDVNAVDNQASWSTGDDAGLDNAIAALGQAN